MATNSSNTNNANLAYALLRLTLGLNITMHGTSRILAGPAHFASTLVPQFQKTILPPTSVYAFGLVLPFVEATLGLLLLLGLATRFALIAGSLLILLLTFGSTLNQDWQAASTQLLYAFLYALLLAFVSRNRYALDTLLRKSR